MKMLTYKQASELLECSYQAISVAVLEKRLTPIATEKGPRLIEDQVRLFIGKRGISDRYLNLEERDTWERCKEEAIEYDTSTTNNKPISEMLQSIDRSLSFVSSLEGIHEKINRCIKLQKIILDKIGVEIPEELNGPFPPLTLNRENA